MYQLSDGSSMADVSHCPVLQEDIVKYIISQENNNMEIQFPLDAYHFHIFMKSKTHKSHHYSVGDLHQYITLEIRLNHVSLVGTDIESIADMNAGMNVGFMLPVTTLITHFSSLMTKSLVKVF